MAMTIIGEKLKELRLQKNLTLRELGKLTNISHSFLADIESGRSVPSIDTLETLADFFGVSTDYLLGRSVVCEPSSSYPTIAAHRTDNIFDRDDVPEEAKKSVEEFIEFVKKKYKIEE